MAKLKVKFIDSDRPKDQPRGSNYAVFITRIIDQTPWEGNPLDVAPLHTVTSALPGHREYTIFLWRSTKISFTEVMQELLGRASLKHVQTMTVVLPPSIEEEFDDDVCPGVIKQGAIERSVELIKASGLESVTFAFAAPSTLSQGFGLFSDP